jgi:hypothetical protein
MEVSICGGITGAVVDAAAGAAGAAVAAGAAGAAAAVVAGGKHKHRA